MDIRQLRQFLAILETGNMRRAAELLHISQPALSKAVRLLEEELGTPLFDRSRKGVYPTASGRVLGEHARLIDTDFRLAIEDINALKGGHTGSLTIGASPSVVQSMLAEVGTRMARHHPDLSIVVIEGTRETWLPALYGGNIDIAIATPPPQTGDVLLDVRPLFDDVVGIMVGAAHPLATRRDLKLQDLQGVQWIAPTRTEEYTRSGLREIFARAGLRLPKMHIETNSASHLRKLILAGSHAAFLPRLLLHEEEQAGAAVLLDMPGTVITRTVAMMQPRRRYPPPGLAHFLDVFQQVQRDMGLGEAGGGRQRTPATTSER